MKQNKHNNTDYYYPKELTIVSLFEKTVENTPDSVAFKENNKTITYRELNNKVNQMSRYMIASGVKQGDIVAVLLERSIDMIIAILSVLKVGGVYLPLSTQYPEERIYSILSDVQTKFIVKSSSIQINLSSFVVLTTNEEEWHHNEKTNIDIHISSSSLAYVIFTSGSTGNPKGSAIRHFSVVNRLLWMINTYSFDKNDVFIQKTVCTFDVSIWEIFIGLLIGAKTYLLNDGEEKNIGIISKSLIKEKITVCHFVPSMLQVFLEYVEHKNLVEKLQSLNNIFSSGEILEYKTVQKFNRLFAQGSRTQLHNLYGPTEATIDVTYFNCTNYVDSLKRVPIGKPIWNTKIYILNDDLTMCDNDEIGEIYISGDNVALGYLNNKELTEKSFLPDSFWKGRVMYKTGDIGVWSENNILYLGRTDNQVKINGYRIELEELENCLNQFIGIKRSVAVVSKEKNKHQLNMYYTSEIKLDSAEISRYFQLKLPYYMIPTKFYRVDEFIYTHSGKIDRKKVSECNIID